MELAEDYHLPLLPKDLPLLLALVDSDFVILIISLFCFFVLIFKFLTVGLHNLNAVREMKLQILTLIRLIHLLVPFELGRCFRVFEPFFSWDL